jgi:hypothetical protein
MPVLEVLPPLPALPAGPLPPGADVLRSEIEAMQSRIQGVEILTDDDEKLACDLETTIDGRLKKNTAVTQAAVTKGHESHKAALAVQAYFCRPLEVGKRLLRAKIGTYREERARRLQEEARRRQLAAAKQEEEERLARAEVLVAHGREEAAMELLAQEPEPVAITVQAPKVPSYGVVTQKRWGAELYDMGALIAWVALDVKARSCYLMVNGPNLNRQAVIMKAVDIGIMGVRGVSKNV